MSLDAFIKEMYRNRSTGDWHEFGDKAQKLKWVDEIVQTVRVGKICFEAAQLPGSLVHQLHKSSHTSGYLRRNDVASFIISGNEHTAQQIPQRHFLSRL